MQTTFTQHFPHLAGSTLTQAVSRLPTEVTALTGLGNNAWVKCDNLTHPEYGGNKIRKLDFIAADILQQQKTQVVTFGAIGTNAGVATAMMCQQLGIDCSIYLFDQPLSTTVKQNLKRMQGYGAELIYCGSLLNTMIRFYLSPYRLRRSSYFLWAGCSNPPAILAYVDAVFELQNQIAQGLLPTPGKIVVPVGSGSTAAGLYLGLHLTGLKCELLPVRVAPAKLGPFDACSDAIINRMIYQGAKLLQLQESPATLPRSRLIHDYFGDGYGCYSSQTQAAITRFKDNGIKLEGTYSGKAAEAFLQQLSETEQPLLFWNTYNSSEYIPENPAAATLPSALQQRLLQRR